MYVSVSQVGGGALGELEGIKRPFGLVGQCAPSDRVLVGDFTFSKQAMSHGSEEVGFYSNSSVK